MNKERELLRRALECWNALGVIKDYDDDEGMDMFDVIEEILTYLSTHSDDAEEPVAWEVTFNRGTGTGTDKLIVRTRDRAEREVKSSLIISVEPLYLHPPKPAESEAEPMSWPIDREWLRSVLRFAEKNPDYFYDVEPGFVSLDGGDTDAVIAALNKPAEPARKPMTEEEIDEAIGGIGNLCVFKAGIRFAEKHHGIGGDDDKQG